MIGTINITGIFADLVIFVVHQTGAVFDMACRVDLFACPTIAPVAEMTLDAMPSMRKILTTPQVSASPSIASPSVITPKMVASPAPNDDVIVSAVVNCDGIVDGDSFSIDAYGFYFRHDYFQPWRGGLSRMMGRVIYDFSSPPPLGVQTVAGQFYGAAIGYPTTGSLTGGTVDNMISAQAEFSSAVVYWGTNGRHVILTEVSSDVLGASAVMTNTLSIGSASGTLQSATVPSITPPVTETYPSSIPFMPAGNPPTYSIGKASYRVIIHVTGTGASLYIDVGRLVFVGRVYGKMDVMAVPSVTLIGGVTAVNMTVNDFTVSVVDRPNPSATSTKTYSKIIHSSPAKNTLSTFGVSITDDKCIVGVEVTGDYLPSSATKIVAVEGIHAGIFPPSGSFTQAANATVTASTIIPPGTHLSPYAMYATITSPAMGKYSVNHMYSG